MKDLPQFRRRKREAVEAFIADVLSNPQTGPGTQLRQLIEYEDGHYRAVFRKQFFVLGEGQTEPTRSQWNTLKKRLKRHDERVFVFKEHGEVPCAPDSPTLCYYIDFGFFAH